MTEDTAGQSAQDVETAAPGPAERIPPDGQPETPAALHSAFPPIGDYAFLSDCETTALVAPNGAVEWMCAAAAWTRPSVFAAMLDRGAGAFRLSPADAEVPPTGATCPARWCWRRAGTSATAGSSSGTPWWSARGSHDPSRSTYQRPPTDYAAAHMLVRTVRCVNGEVQLLMDCEPVFDYGRHRATWAHAEAGYHQAIAHADRTATSALTLTTDLRLGFEGPRAVGPLAAQGGRRPLLRAVLGRRRRRPRPSRRPTSG